MTAVGIQEQLDRPAADADDLDALLEREAADVTPAMRLPSPTPEPGQTEPEWLEEVSRLRAQHDAMALDANRIPPEAGGRSAIAQSRYLDIPAGSTKIAARAYRPAGEPPYPAVVIFHGGAWWMGGGATGYRLNDDLCRAVCGDVNALVVNVDYRLAPEHRYPVQLEDGYAALKYLADDPDGLGVDPSRIALLGISSGGNLAAGLSLLTYHRGGPAVRVQILVHPVLDVTGSVLAEEHDEPSMSTLTAIRDLYMHTTEVHGRQYASPVLVPDLSGQPPTVVFTAGSDPLRHEGRRYTERLQKAGVDATLFEYPGTHTTTTRTVRQERNRELLAALRRLL